MSMRLRPHRAGAPPEPPTATLNALTFDVEDYYQVSAFDGLLSRTAWDGMPSRVLASTERLLALCDEAGVRATFFVLGYVAWRHRSLVRAISRAGHEVGCHGFWHRLIYEQTPGEFRDDVRQARDLLEEIVGAPVTSYRAPSFSVTRRSEWALDVLLEEGFLIDSSVYPVRHDRYGLPGAAPEPHPVERHGGLLWEFPPPVWRVCGYPLPVGGGGYFRLYPYPLTKHGLRSINRAGRPFAFYLHPWEVDPAQPRLSAGWLRSWRHYVGLKRTEGRLARLLRDFRFGTLTEALDAYRGVLPEGRAA